ncbi:MAG: CRTAC1 family protein [Gammaproteobacteria bacterium]|nr:CRTAC1 family protein [Gammaproteobacteria bacterium]
MAGVADPRFSSVAESAGLDFKHVNGMAGERWIVETVGAGVGVLDFDGDGRLDIWLVQGGPLLERADGLPSDRLFRNASTGGTLHFEDVTDLSGVSSTEYGMGVAAGDMDNDGDADVFVANFGPNRLFENLGDGRFRDITEHAGLAAREWSVSASWADIDGDGLLDLYVVNYLDYAITNNKVCRDIASRAAYCAPSSYAPVPDRLYRNLGRGRFDDISDGAGISGVAGPGLGVVSHDFDADGAVDFYVANDGAANSLWLNQGDGRFEDGAGLAFVAVNGNGAAEAGMGVDAEDFDADCDVDLFVTHLATETNTLYVNQGDWFSDSTNQAGLAASSGPFTGFGTGWFDADNDGDLDLFSANGAVSAIAALREAGDAYPLRQRNQLWLNNGRGRYTEILDEPAFGALEVSRGVAFADLDNDGDVDLVTANNSGAARVYRNMASASWIGVDLRGRGGGTAVGAEVWLESSPCPRRRVATDGSFASANDPRIIFGRADDATPQTVLVRWPDGTEARFGPLVPGRYHRLQQPPEPGVDSKELP